MKQRQSDFAFLEIVAGRFADGVAAEVVEYVVSQLEAQTEQAREFGERLGALIGYAGGIASHFRTCYEEGGRVVADYIIICVFGQRMVARIIYLVDLAER